MLVALLGDTSAVLMRAFLLAGMAAPVPFAIIRLPAAPPTGELATPAAPLFLAPRFGENGPRRLDLFAGRCPA